MRRKKWTGNGYRKWILFSTLWVKSISFLSHNRNGKAHKENALVERKKRRYSPCNWGYTA